MDGTLTLSSKLSPFPFAAIAIASYTQKSALNFDESATGITLDFNGSKITSVDEIVHALAKAGDLSGDSAKVSQPMGLCNNIDFKKYAIRRRRPTLLWQKRCPVQLRSQK
jgi:glutamyl-tRNA synthetase